MMRASFQVAVAIALVCIANVAAGDDFTSFSDVQLAERAREAVGAQDAKTALDLLTEMQRRGTGIFAAADRPSCEEVIDLPEGITDWRFKGAARQAYIREVEDRPWRRMDLMSISFWSPASRPGVPGSSRVPQAG